MNKLSKSIKEVHKWSKQEVEYLGEITPGHHYHEIVNMMNDKFEYNFSMSQVRAAIKRHNFKTGFTGCFQKGSIPANKGTKGLTGANKTSFKPGQRPMNYKPIGSERVNVYGYIEIKVEEPRVWKLKHRIVYEETYGPIPKGYNVIFGDGNKLNCDISNLILVSKNQLLIMNRNKLIRSNIETTKSGVIIADIMIKVSKLNK